MRKTKRHVHDHCTMNKRLEIMYDEYTNSVQLSRCCYTEVFSLLQIKEFLKIKDIFEYSTQKRKHRIKDWAKGWCATRCDIQPEIKVVTVGLSRACNLHCYHCFFTDHKDSSELRDLYFETLERIKGHNLDVIHMQSSGEVFFYYFKIREYLKSLSINDTKEVNFQTNGLLLNDERLQELKQISEETGVKYTFSYSFDAITEETYKKVRIGGDFNKLIHIFEKTLDLYGKDKVQCSFTIKEPNKHEAALFRKFFIDNYNFYSTYVTYDCLDKSCHDLFNSLNQEEIN